MTVKEHLLICLAEECAEIQKLVSKSLRFGMDDQYIKNRTNRGDLINELNDLMGVIELLKDEGVSLEGFPNQEAIEAKKQKVTKYLDYSRQVGTLNDINSHGNKEL